MAAINGKIEDPSVPVGIAAAHANSLHSTHTHADGEAIAGVYVLQRGRFRYVEHRLARILGYEEPQALIGRSFWQWVHPEDRQRVCLFRGKSPFRWIKEDGTVLCVHMSGVNTRFDDRPANAGCLVYLGIVSAGSGMARPGPSGVAIEKGAQEHSPWGAIIGRSDAVCAVRRLIQNLADLEATVLLRGEHGTGKELIARALHFQGRRAVKPFTMVNCSAMSENLLESELFGHSRGAFKGASHDKRGHLLAADGGTVFLDDIADITPLLQRKILRLLQDKSFERLGESITRKADVRIIACTTKDLRRKVKTGEFNEMLYQQLNVVEIVVPPLRERLEDVPLLVEHFRQRFNAWFDKEISGVTEEALARLMAYQWPGNVGELEQVLEHAFLLCREEEIAVAHLPSRIRTMDWSNGSVAIVPIHVTEGARDVLEALSRSYWNRTKAADLLGVSRQTLYRKIRAYKIFEMM